MLVRLALAIAAGSVALGVPLAAVLPEPPDDPAPVAQAASYQPVYAAPQLYADEPPAPEGLECGRNLDCSPLDHRATAPKVTRRHVVTITDKGRSTSDSVTVKQADGSSSTVTVRHDPQGKTHKQGKRSSN